MTVSPWHVEVSDLKVRYSIGLLDFRMSAPARRFQSPAPNRYRRNRGLKSNVVTCNSSDETPLIGSTLLSYIRVRSMTMQPKRSADEVNHRNCPIVFGIEIRMNFSRLVTKMKF